MNKIITRTPEEESDHNLLITLNNKVDSLTQSVEKMNDGIRTRIRELELKVETHQVIIDKVDPLETYKRFEKVEQTQNYMKFALYMIGVIGIIISWTTGFVDNIINIFKK